MEQRGKKLRKRHGHKMQDIRKSIQKRTDVSGEKADKNGISYKTKTKLSCSNSTVPESWFAFFFERKTALTPRYWRSTSHQHRPDNTAHCEGDTWL